MKEELVVGRQLALSSLVEPRTASSRAKAPLRTATGPTKVFIRSWRVARQSDVAILASMMSSMFRCQTVSGSE